MNRLIAGFIMIFVLPILALANEIPGFNSWDFSSVREDLYFRRDTEILQKQNLDELNQKMMDLILAYQPEVSAGRASGISLIQAEQLINNLLSDPSYIERQKQYDPANNLGFCFGRALKLHLDLLRYGVNKDSIKKIFVIGPMSVPGQIWQFHVATIVKDLNSNNWWALDINLKQPVSVGDWVSYYKRHSMDQTFQLFNEPEIDPTKSLRFYITSPKKIGPNGWEYNIRPGGLFHESYNNYFKDMFKAFKQFPIPASEKFNFNQCSKLF